MRCMSRCILEAVESCAEGCAEGARGCAEDRAEDAKDNPGYRDALIESAVSINAAMAAFDLRQEVERNAKWEIEVLYGVHNIRSHQVCMPVDPVAPFADKNVRLAHAPANPKDFHTLAIEMAEILAPKANKASAPPLAIPAIAGGNHA